jgi:hypothetical protein
VKDIKQAIRNLERAIAYQRSLDVTPEMEHNDTKRADLARRRDAQITSATQSIARAKKVIESGNPGSRGD